MAGTEPFGPLDTPITDKTMHAKYLHDHSIQKLHMREIRVQVAIVCLSGECSTVRLMFGTCKESDIYAGVP
jgi:hypothetical protein